ncbi:MAG: M48 family metallopeptidase [Candidatus Marinamargulisbacteria bacterium]
MLENIIVKPNARRTRYALQIGDQGEVIVKTPLNPSESVVADLVRDHQSWIKKHQQKAKQTQERLASWQDPNQLMYRGQLVEIKQTTELATVFGAGTIHLAQGLTKASFIQTHAKLYLPERCLDIAEMMGLTTKKIRIRRMTSCWGTCHHNTTITLNEALIQTPDWVSDYVMIHECAHLVYFDHSRDFWALVAKYTDHTKSAKKWLKEHQAALLTKR